jgi:CDK inhibitor PHO81
MAVKLIKALSATPVLPAQSDGISQNEPLDPQAALQANKATFFFRLVSLASILCYKLNLMKPQDRELEKVNTFYLQKEAEVCIHPG